MSKSGPSLRPEALLRQYGAWEPRTDKCDFQWRLRLLQSLWRAERGLSMNRYRGKERGAQLQMPEAQQTLDNYLTPAIRETVRREVLNPVQSQGKLYGKPRIFNNLLSSQPLAFNLFAELSQDLDLASQVLSLMTRAQLYKVTAIEFEWSPGRSNPRYTGDRSAFDVYVKYDNAKGGHGFLGIEVKYHENLRTDKNYYRDRYDEVAARMRCFREESLPLLRGGGRLQQVWRDHLLVGAHALNEGWDGVFVLLYPEANTACAAAVEDYTACLSDTRTFQAWTLDALVACLMRRTDAQWVRDFRTRYLDMSRLPTH